MDGFCRIHFSTSRSDGRVGPGMIDHYSSSLKSQVGLTNKLVRTPCRLPGDW